MTDREQQVSGPQVGRNAEKAGRDQSGQGAEEPEVSREVTQVVTDVLNRRLDLSQRHEKPPKGFKQSDY